VTISLVLVGADIPLAKVSLISKLVAFVIVKLLPDISKMIFPN
jgi:hypothetical protein